MAPSTPVAIVTGAPRNIGRRIACALAADGAAVLVHAHADRAGAEETAGLIGQAGGRAQVHLADLTDPAQATGLVAACVDALGPPTILVNNAARRPHQMLAEITYDDWRAVLAIDLDAAFLLAQACRPHMIAAGGGRIVNLGGKSGHAGAPGRVHVVTAKAALVGLSKGLAVELGEHGITVNCVVPGDIAITRSESAGPRPKVADNLVGRMGKPEEVAAVVAMLCRPEGAYVTGQTIHVNGGAYLP
jgi:3-oxoacyl-[acyl-carrier protein] reductase